MKLSLVFAASLSLPLLLSTYAFAADAPASPGPVAPTEPAPAAAPVAPASGCALGDHAGINEEDAKTAARIVCGEVGNAGGRVTEPYRVDLSRLGESVVLSLSYGETTRSLRLARIEEVPVAAPRVADAVVHGTSIASTEKIDNLVGDETRRYGKRPGELHFGVGVLGATFAGSSFAFDPGLVGQILYEAPRFAVGIDIRGAWASSQLENRASYFAVGPTARYFFGEGDISPFAGGGFALSSLSLTPKGEAEAAASGLTPFAEIGIEALRLHRARVALGIRCDFPLYSLRSNATYTSYGPGGSPTTTSIATSATGYHAPVSLALNVAW